MLAARFSLTPAGAEHDTLSKAFNTPTGQVHLRALVDLLGITWERATRMKLALLQSVAALGCDSTS